MVFFLSCGHGLDFDTSLCDNSINQNLSIKTTSFRNQTGGHGAPLQWSQLLCFFYQVYIKVCLLYGHDIEKSMDQPGKAANPTRGQLNKGNKYFPVPVHA